MAAPVPKFGNHSVRTFENASHPVGTRLVIGRDTMNFRVLTCGLFVVTIGSAGLWAGGPQRTATTAPRAATKPLSATLLKARTAFLINEAPGPESNAAFQTLQGELRRWKRFDLVDQADRADVTVSLTTKQVERVSEIGAPRGARLVNPRTAIVRSNVSTVTIRQRATSEVLWSGDSETIVAVLRPLQQQMTVTPSVCVAVWCW